MDGLRAALSSHTPCEFERDECAHAVAEERERFVQVRSECLSGAPHQLVYVSARRLRDARASSRELNRTDFDRIRETLLPRTKDRISATSVRKAEEAHAGASIRLPVNKPRRSHLMSLTVLTNISRFRGSSVSNLMYWSLSPNSEPHITRIPRRSKTFRRSSASARARISTYPVSVFLCGVTSSNVPCFSAFLNKTKELSISRIAVEQLSRRFIASVTEAEATTLRFSFFNWIASLEPAHTTQPIRDSAVPCDFDVEPTRNKFFLP